MVGRSHGPRHADAGAATFCPMPPGMLLVISGPSGVGKTTIVRALRKRLPDNAFSVSATTRQPTAADSPGQDYHFLTHDEFQRRVDAGDFLEHAVYAGNRYGTLRGPVEEHLAAGRLVILDIDVQGGRSVRATAPDSFGVFLLPPGEGVLLERLRARGREPEDVIQRRFAEARREVAEAQASGAYDVFLVNDSLDRTIEEAVRVIEAERERRAGARAR